MLTVSPGSSSLLQCSSSSASSTVDTLSKFYSQSSGSSSGFMSCSAAAAGDQRSSVGFPAGCGGTGYSNYGTVGNDGLPAYQAYSAYAGAACAGSSAGMDYLKVRPSPYSVGSEYPAYFSRLHQVGGSQHHAGSRTASSAAATSGQIGYDYGSVG